MDWIAIGVEHMKLEIKGNIIYQDRLYDTNELLQLEQILIRKLSHLDLCEDEVVAITMPRTPRMLIAMVAMYNLNIPFLPIDYEQPEERIKYMITNAQVRYALSEGDFVLAVDGIQMVYVDSKEEDYSDERKNNNSTIAYILYTSGSTGKPKAVEVTRKGFNNFMLGIPEIINFTTHQKIACTTNQTFDIFFLESLLPLQCGLTVVLADNEENNNPKKIVNLLIKHEVQIVQMAPSKFKMLMRVDEDFDCLKTVSTIMVGGESFPESLLQTLQRKTSASIYNMYGPTETTIWSTVSNLTNKSYITVGGPIRNTQIYLLDEWMDPVPDGSIGEICIGGDGLAKGYRNNEEQTNRCFKEYSRNQIYKTGDLGKYNENGELLCLGRIDNQVKLRGHRIELDEIDNQLSIIYERQLLVTCFYQSEVLSELITFYVNYKEIPKEEFIETLGAKLPEYMVPNKFIRVDNLQYTSSGKVDRPSMLAAYIEKIKCKESVTETINIEENDKNMENNELTKEEQIYKIMNTALNNPNLVINKEMPLYVLRFDSITFINFIVEVEDTFDIEFDSGKLSIDAFGSVASLLEYINTLFE